MGQDRLPGLQIARAIAALSIAYFHSWVALERFPKDTAFSLPILTSHGWLAVDLFFAISGFVICLVVSRPYFNIASFLTKRALRLYPLWLATLTSFAILALLWRAPKGTETLGYFVYSATLLPTEQFPFYDIGWSLQHEMTFYLIAAIIVPIFGLYGLAIFLATSTIAFHTIEMPWYLSNFAMYHAEFLAGVLAFIFKPTRFGAVGPLIIGAIALWVSVTALGRSYVPFALFFLIVGFANIKEQKWTKPFESLGDASYSIYLIHPIIFLIASAFVSKAVPPVWSQEIIRAGCFAAIIGISIASWKWFERPFIKSGNAISFYAARMSVKPPM